MGDTDRRAGAHSADEETREDELLLVLRYGAPIDARRALAAADETTLTRAVLRRALRQRQAIQGVLLDRPAYQPATLARLAEVLAHLCASGSADAPTPDLVARFGDRYPGFAALARQHLLAALTDAENTGDRALECAIEAALFSEALAEDDLLALIEAGAGRVRTAVLQLAAAHPAATPLVWRRLLELDHAPTLAAAVAARPAARRDPALLARLRTGPPEVSVELALDADAAEFRARFSALAEGRPDLALVVLERASAAQREWIPIEALARLLEAEDADVRQHTIAALGRLRIPHPPTSA